MSMVINFTSAQKGHVVLLNIITLFSLISSSTIMSGDLSPEPVGGMFRFYNKIPRKITYLSNITQVK